MAGHQCYHCKAFVQPGEAHDCWTTTEAALTADLPEDLREAWERLREAAVALGEQRIYASHSSIMFARKACYFFVRPKTKFLEVCVFLGRAITAPQIRRVEQTSKAKKAHFIRITHRDEVEPPITDWLEEAYRLPDVLAARARVAPAPKTRSTAKSTARKPAAVKRPRVSSDSRVARARPRRPA